MYWVIIWWAPVRPVVLSRHPWTLSALVNTNEPQLTSRRVPPEVWRLARGYRQSKLDISPRVCSWQQIHRQPNKHGSGVLGYIGKPGHLRKVATLFFTIGAAVTNIPVILPHMSEPPGQTRNHPTPPATAGIPTVKSGAIPPATASRLGLYLRELQHFMRSGTETIKSSALGRRLGLSDSQIRRDLALFGEFGKRGVGYNVAGLVGALRRALGTDGQWNTVLIGLGNLGNALVRYRGFTQQGFVLQAIFEADPSKIGQEIDGVPIYGIEHLESVLPRLQVQMAILAVPAAAAPALANRLADLGISGILNFAPVSLSSIPNVAKVDVDLAVELQRLAFAVVNPGRSG